METHNTGAVPAPIDDPEAPPALEPVKTFTLRTPLKLFDKDENPISEITLQEPDGDQISKFLKASAKPGADDMEAGMIFIDLNSGIALASIKKMKARDLQDCMAYLSSFTDASPKAG